MREEFDTLDVREDLKAGREPLTAILRAAGRLRSGCGLRLIAPFKPVPLFAVLGRMGFSYEARQAEPGQWEILFRRTTTGAAVRPATPSDSSVPTPPGRVVDVDARGLEPPQPMVTILEALSALPLGAGLRARTDRRPLHLYAALEERGFTAHSEENSDGSFTTHIRRA